MSSSELPDALEEALARIIAAERKQWIREREHIEAEYRALVAELRAEVLSLRVALREQTDAEIMRLREALAKVRDGHDGSDGSPGEKGEPGPAGLPGKDADPEAVAEIVLARMPAPEPGPAGKDADPEEVAVKAAAIVLEGLPVPADGKDGRDGADGKDADPAVIEALVTEKVAAAVAALPFPEKGEQGEKGDPGEDVDMDTVAVMIEEATRRSVADLPPPKDGKDADPELMRQMISEEVAKLPPAEPGRDGKNAEVDYGMIVEKVIAVLPPAEKGEPGRDGKDAEVDYELITGFVAEEVIQRVAELPPPEKGERGDKGEKGDPGEQGSPGRDGADIVEFLTDSEDMLVATLSDGRIRMCGGPVRGTKGEPGAPGRDGKDGKDGQDGVGFDDLEVIHDGGRHATLRFVKGDRVKEYQLALPGNVYQGVWQEGVTYAVGDTVTWSGSVWHANAETDTKPGNGNTLWTLCVKKGMDGRNGKDGEKGERGPQGPAGRDLTLR